MALVPRLNSVTRNIEQGDLNPVGMIVASMLTQTQFQSLNGTSWVLAYGQSIAGSTYASVTGNSTAPDLRGRTLAGVDNMGGSQANVLTTGTGGFGGNRNTIGGTGGAETKTLATGELPSHNHPDSGHNHSQNAHGHSGRWGNGGGPANVLNSGSVYNGSAQDQNMDNSILANTATNNASTANNAAAGSGTPYGIMQPTAVINYFIKIN